ncbi:MAG: ribose-phosphate pyrophosphokinase [Firmicutes bacterium]|nr:ribose-phosphate pyrophosphokinase [Bacillota bacterium]
MEAVRAPKWPVGKLGIISMKGCEEISAAIDKYLVSWHNEKYDNEIETFIVKTACPRFNSGEGKGVVYQSVRGFDIYIICDVFNYGVTYKMYNKEVPMSPDDHYQDLKRVIGAIEGKARRITVIMPMLYESRQHKRTARESLDCALALKELVAMGVDDIITFDAHDPRVQNAIPLNGFENVQAYYQMIKALLKNYPDIEIDKEHLMVCSPDEGGMNRCIYYSSVLGLDLGMFYKRRDYSKIVNGRNPIVSHDFLGDNVQGKDIIIVDDMIASGESLIDVSKKLKEKGANKIYAFITFGLFVDGLSKFDEAYEKGYIEKIFTTNLTYRKPELLERKWYASVDMSKYLAIIIDTLNYDKTISDLIDPVKRINTVLEKRNK